MPAVTQDTITITGELADWRGLTPDGWGVGHVRTVDRTIAVTGKLMARVGDTIELVGVWTEHARFGRQLKVRTCTVATPESAEGIIAWLTSTLPSIGPGRARALVERFGAGLWAVIESRPAELAEVPGITVERLEDICAAYHAHRAERDDMIRLRGWGLTDSQIGRCREVWGSIAVVVEHVHANPYTLTEHVHGFGFLRADKVARRAGIAHDAPARVAAGVEYTLETAIGAGDCFLWGAVLQRRAAELLEVPPAVVAIGIRTAIASGRIARRDRGRYYPRRIDEAEDLCAVHLGRMIARVRDAGGDAHAAEMIDLDAARQRHATKG
jgi:exodeoxyribonuclease V alpha subunit